jgi:hypothetical protein
MNFINERNFNFLCIRTLFSMFFPISIPIPIIYKKEIKLL